MFGSNALLQLGRPGAERKLAPFPSQFAKSKRIIYLHAELTSTFAMSGSSYFFVVGFTTTFFTHDVFGIIDQIASRILADKRMYFW
jgi:hypothetical protein